MTLAGPVDVELEVILSTTDADFVVRLIDVFPDDDPQSGCRMLVRGDVMRGVSATVLAPQSLYAGAFRPACRSA